MREGGTNMSNEDRLGAHMELSKAERQLIELLLRSDGHLGLTIGLYREGMTMSLTIKKTAGIAGIQDDHWDLHFDLSGKSGDGGGPTLDHAWEEICGTVNAAFHSKARGR